MEDVALGQAVGSFEIQWCENLAYENRARDVWRVFGDLLDDAVTKQLAFLVPIPFAQLVRHKLHKASEDVTPRRRERAVRVRGHGTIDPQFFRYFAKFCDVVATLGKFQRGYEGEERTLLGRRTFRGTRKSWFFAQYQVHFRARACHFDSANGFDKFCRQL